MDIQAGGRSLLGLLPLLLVGCLFDPAGRYRCEAGDLSCVESDAGTMDGGGSVGGGGGVSDGGTQTGPFAFGVLSIPSSVGLTFVSGVSANATEVWAVTSNGRFFRATTGAFSEVLGIAPATTAGVYVAPDGAVFTAQSYRLVRCSSGCVTGTNHVVTSYPASEFVAVCGSSSTDVYFVGDDSPTMSVLVHWDGNALTTVSTNLGLGSPRACYLAPGGALYVAGRRDVVRWEGGAAFAEVPDLASLGTGAATQQWYGVGGANGEVFAVGGRHVIRRTAPGAWTLQASVSPGSLNAVAGISATEVYAAGYEPNATSLYRWQGNLWEKPAAQLPVTLANTHAIFVRNAGDVFFGGLSSSQAPVVVHGTR